MKARSVHLRTNHEGGKEALFVLLWRTAWTLEHHCMSRISYQHGYHWCSHSFSTMIADEPPPPLQMAATPIWPFSS